MSINSGNFRDMAIKTSMDMGSNQYIEHNSIQVFLIHLLASNLLVFLLLLYQLWNEIFGGLFFGFFASSIFPLVEQKPVTS